jgi:hypothetical protein
MLFHATSKTRTEAQDVTALILDTSNPGETQTLSGKRIVIPPVAPNQTKDLAFLGNYTI